MRNKLTILLIMVLLMVVSTASVFAAHEQDAGAYMSPEDIAIAQENNPDFNPNEASYSEAQEAQEAVGRAERSATYDYENDSMNSIMKETKLYYAFSIEEDGGLLGSISLAAAVNSISNVVFGFARAIIQLSANITGWAMDLEMYKVLDSFLGDSDSPFNQIFDLGTGVFTNTGEGLNGLVWLGVMFSLATVVLLFARRQTAGAFGKILGTILIMVFISSYAQLPGMFMEGAQKFVSEAGSSILGGEDGTSPGRATSEQIWLMGVDAPWQELEFGSIKVKISDGGALKPGTKVNEWLLLVPADRALELADESLVESLTETMADDVPVQAGRVGECFLILVLDFILALVFILLAAIALGFQIAGLLMWVLGFFIMVLALFPTHGVGKIKEWAGALAVTYFGQIVVYVAILLVTQIMTAFFGLDSMWKTFGAIFGLSMAIFLMKGQLGRLFTPSVGGPDIGGGVVNMGKHVRDRAAYRGDSTQRVMSSPIRMNREAKRMAQREAKMQAYQTKMAEKKEQQIAKSERSVTRAVGQYVTSKASQGARAASKPARNVADQVNERRARTAERIRTAAKPAAERQAQMEEKRVMAHEAAQKEYIASAPQHHETVTETHIKHSPASPAASPGTKRTVAVETQTQTTTKREVKGVSMSHGDARTSQRTAEPKNSRTKRGNSPPQ